MWLVLIGTWTLPSEPICKVGVLSPQMTNNQVPQRVTRPSPRPQRPQRKIQSTCEQNLCINILLKCIWGTEAWLEAAADARFLFLSSKDQSNIQLPVP